jgi:hypothetical protein
MPEHQRRASETVDELSTLIVTTHFTAVLASREKAYGCILAALIATEASTLQRVLSVFDELAAAGVKSISPVSACDMIRSLQARAEFDASHKIDKS